ncbi:MAG: 50S ribosomal protein L11 methyltransferase, partial [Trueperaceae bacterium]
MKTFRFQADLEADPPEAAALWEFGCRGMQQQGGTVVAWFDHTVPLDLDGVWGDADDTDWLQRYLHELEPVPIGSLVVAPTHRAVTLTAGRRALWLDPGMAFGTGHHETTRMALAWLERTPLRGATVLDVGAGSGILAIAADLLGAERALGVDVDAATVPV